MYWFCSVPNHSSGFHNGQRRAKKVAELVSTPSLVSKIIRPGSFKAKTISASSQTSTNQRQLAADQPRGLPVSARAAPAVEGGPSAGRRPVLQGMVGAVIRRAAV